MAETENAMPESAQVDSRPAFAIVEELKTKFGENFYVQTTFEDFPTVWVERARVQEVLMFLRTVSRPYVMLFDLSAVDERLRTHRDGLPASDFTVFYHLLSLERNSDIRIKVALSENDVNLPTATNIWPNANWYEREAYDMFGINFEGHPMLRRILLPTYWEGHPLRKEYSARATEYTPYMQNQAKQDYEQEHLRFVPEDWGMKRGNDDEDFMFLNLGPNHPSAHGAFRVILQLDGEEVKDCVPDIGYHHRGVEKMAERQTWHSFIPYTDRVDYLGGCAQNMPYVMGVEQMAGITVPDRAQCIRSQNPFNIHAWLFISQNHHNAFKKLSSTTAAFCLFKKYKSRLSHSYFLYFFANHSNQLMHLAFSCAIDIDNQQQRIRSTT
jgi:NADH-quinone oxidoreductase subunit C/D